MNETPQQYTQRILGYVEGKEPLAVQAGTAKELERLIAGVPASKLRELSLLIILSGAKAFGISDIQG